jgi:hypothetical protein
MRTEIAYDLAVRVAPPDDRARFEKLLDRHHRRMRRFAAGIVADRDRVDDGLQEPTSRPIASCLLTLRTRRTKRPGSIA